MVSNKKEKFSPNYYQQSLYKQAKYLKQKETCVSEYIKEFLKLSLKLRLKRVGVSKCRKVCEWNEVLYSRWDKYPLFLKHGLSISNCFKGRGKYE